MQYTDSENEWVQFIMGKCERQMDEDAGNTHVIDDREMTYMGHIGEMGHTRVPL